MAPSHDESAELQTFLVQLGAAMNASGQPVDVVQDRLMAVARAAGAVAARISAFPTYLLVTMGRGEPATLELTTAFAGTPRLDQIALIDRLSRDAAHGKVEASDGLRRLHEIRELPRRFGPLIAIGGYAVQTIGVCLILRPGPADVVAAGGLGLIVGVLQSLARRRPGTTILLPVVAAFSVSALTALAVRAGVADPGLRAMVAALVVFLPGSVLTNAVLELAAGEMVSGSSRFIAGVFELALLAFGIVAGIQAVGIPADEVFSGSPEVWGAWAPWLGVLLFAVGVTIAHSAPRRSFLGLLVVLLAAWIGQIVGNTLLGAYASALVGATVMTVVAFVIARFPSTMPPHALFLPGFWLLVPGALGLIGLTQFAGGTSTGGTEDLLRTVGSIFGVALGVVVGTHAWSWAVVSGKVLSSASDSMTERVSLLRRLRRRP